MPACKKVRPILFAGGGTLGPVFPLLAIAEAWRAIDADMLFVWVGTPLGPERRFVEPLGVPFYPLSVPKFTRYPSVSWLLLPLHFLRSLLHAWRLLWHVRPAWILSAGGYVAVPLVWLGRLFGARVMVYQLDAPMGLANRLMAPVAHTFYRVWAEGGAKHARVVGMATRADRFCLPSREEAAGALGLSPLWPTILVLGGGTGSVAINRAFEEAAEELVKAYQVVHLTGKGKGMFAGRTAPEGYKVFEELDQTYPYALSAADVVVTRAGMGALSDVVAGRKATILVPLSGAQEENARLAKRHGAALVLPGKLSGETLIQKIAEAFVQRPDLEECMETLFPVRGVAEKIVDDLLSTEKK